MWENKTRTAISEAFLAALQEDEIPWRKCWSAGPISMSSGKPYKGINNLMLSWMAYKRGYQDTRWLTYKYAQDHGWQVRKGEKSVRVEYWQHYDFELKKALTRDDVIRIQREEPERMKNIRLVAYTANVFNVEQIDGDIPPLKRAGTIQDPAALKRCRNAFLTNLGVAFGEGGDRAYYSPSLDKIQMPPAETFTGDYAYMCTLLHEAGHSTGHPSRLDRDMSGGFGSPEYAKEELRAEIASAFTAQALQLPYKEDELDFEMENHKAYVQSWIAVLQKDPDELFAAIKDANQIADYLLEHGQLKELIAQESFAFEYQLLSRLKMDCDYFLGAGGRHEKHLWAGNVRDQIAKIRELYDILPVKPEWLPKEKIDKLEKLMAPRYLVVVYHHFKNSIDEKLEYQTLWEAKKAAEGYTDGTIGVRYDGAAVYDVQDRRFLRVIGDFPAPELKPLQHMSVEELSRGQIDELKRRLFRGTEDQERIRQPLGQDQIDTIENAKTPEEIPDELVKELYVDTDFTPNDFLCSYQEVETTAGEEEDETEM